MLYTVFEYAIKWNFYTGNNPAEWKGLHELRWGDMPRGRNQPAMPFEMIPKFFTELRPRQREATAAIALELLILSACRAGEILGLRWDEIKWEEKMIVLPPERTKQGKRKGGKEHYIPLTERMIQILRELEKEWSGGEYVLTGYSDAALAEKSPLKYLQDSMGYRQYTVHGFRSSFSEWAYEKTEFDPYLIEWSMGHAPGTTVANRYNRRTAPERRRELMEAWSQYCSSATKPGLRVVSATA
jgi:integrase